MGLSPSGRPTGLNAIQDLAEEATASAVGVIEKVKCAAAAAAAAVAAGGETTPAAAQANGEEAAASR